jgi:pimeloyl-ACP methyl ester carboxylesterase
MRPQITRDWAKRGFAVLAALALLFCLTCPPGLADLPVAQTGQALRAITHAQIEAKYATSNSHFAGISGVRLHYKDQGSGPAILLIHGSLGDTEDWDVWADMLKQKYRVVRFDLPGFGLSGEIGSGNYAIDHSLALVDGLMDTLGIERFAIVGVSYGGPVAFRYAATRTDRVSALVIMNSAGIEAGKQPADKKTGAKSFFNAATSPQAVTTDYVQSALEISFHDRTRIPAGMVQRKTDFLNVAGRDREAAMMIALYERGNPAQVLAHVTAPTLVLWGGAERALSLSTADRFVAALTHAKEVRKVVVPGGDHFMHVELAKETCMIVENFLNSVLIKQ